MDAVEESLMTLAMWLTQIQSWAFWSQALTSTAIIGAFGLLLALYLKPKFEKSIQHPLDQKIEELRSKLRTDEEAAKAAFKSRDTQISALQSGALSGMSARHATIDARRIRALERIWVIATGYTQFKSVAKFSESIKIDVMLESAWKNDHESVKIREFSAKILEICGIGDLKDRKPMESAENERIFVPPIVWALFTAYQRIISYPVAQLIAVQNGLKSDILADPKELLDLAKSTLPTYVAYIDKFGPTAIPFLVKPAEEALFSAIVNSLDSSPSDGRLVEQAAAILKVAASADIAQEAELAELKIPEQVRVQKMQ